MLEISIIVPVYKVESYLDRCVKSILNQTYTDFELILVDDGSPDKCPQMCDEWARKDKRIRVIHNENGGVSAARNAGIDIANGKYIMFVDSDDWIERDTAEHMRNLLLKYDADFSMAENTREINLVINEERCLSQEEFLKWLFKIGTQKNVQYPWAKLYKKELFSDVRYPDGIAVAEDVFVTFEVSLRSKRIAYSSKVIYNYFINGSSATGIGFSEKTFDLISTWDLVCDTAKRYHCKPEVIEMAELNRKRADFGVLADLAISGNCREDYHNYQKQIDEIRKNLKKNLKELLKAQIPVSRKVVMTGLALFFKPSLIAINKITYFSQKLRMQRGYKNK